MSTVTDTHEFTITVIEHGLAEIVNIVVPTTPIHMNEAFDIAYDVENTGTESDTLYGHIKDENGDIITGTEWEETINGGESVSKSFIHPGFATTGAYTLTIEAGHN